MLTSRARSAGAGGCNSMHGLPLALPMPGWAVLKSLMYLIFVLPQHLQPQLEYCLFCKDRHETGLNRHAPFCASQRSMTIKPGKDRSAMTVYRAGDQSIGCLTSKPPDCCYLKSCGSITQEQDLGAVHTCCNDARAGCCVCSFC